MSKQTFHVDPELCLFEYPASVGPSSLQSHQPHHVHAVLPNSHLPPVDCVYLLLGGYDCVSFTEVPEKERRWNICMNHLYHYTHVSLTSIVKPGTSHPQVMPSTKWCLLTWAAPTPTAPAILRYTLVLHHLLLLFVVVTKSSWCWGVSVLRV